MFITSPFSPYLSYANKVTHSGPLDSFKGGSSYAKETVIKGLELLVPSPSTSRGTEEGKLEIEFKHVAIDSVMPV